MKNHNITSPWNYITAEYVEQPNSGYYLIAILANNFFLILVLYHFFYLYIKSSRFFIHVAPIDFKKIINRFELKQESMEFLDTKFWPIIWKIIGCEFFLFVILRILLDWSFLKLSLIILIFSFIISLINFFILGPYIQQFSNLELALNLKLAKYNSMEHDFLNVREYFKDKGIEGAYDESTLQLELEKMKTLKYYILIEEIAGINSGTVELDPAAAEAELDETLNIGFGDWVRQPAKAEIISFSYYFYYIIYVCQDSRYLYEIIWPLLFGEPKPWIYQYTTKTKTDPNIIIEDANTYAEAIEHLPQLQTIDEVFILSADFLQYINGWL